MLIQILITIAVIAIEFVVIWVLIVAEDKYWMKLGRNKPPWDNVLIFIVMAILFTTYCFGAWNIAKWLIN